MSSKEDFLAFLKDENERFGVLAESNTYQLTVIAKNTDVAVGDLFLLPSTRGCERIYIFRTTQYANILNRAFEMNDVARSKLTMNDSYFSQDLNEDKLIELKGMVLGYAERHHENNSWSFHRPRRLPEHLTDVFRVDPEKPEICKAIALFMQSQLGSSGLYIGDLLAGEQSLKGVPLYLPPYALSHHIGVYGRTGSGKSNLMMVLLKSIMDYNKAVKAGKAEGPCASIFAIDPHDEFKNWHKAIGRKDGIHGIVQNYSDQEKRDLVEPFYYLTAKDAIDDEYEHRVFLSRADIIPDDLISITEFSEQQSAFTHQFYAEQGRGEEWVYRLLLNDVQEEDNNNRNSRNRDREERSPFLDATVAAVRRRIGFLRRGHTRIFTPFDPENGDYYVSTLPEIICALEQGRVLIVDTTLMNEMEQFLLSTIVARVLFAIRKALRSSADRPELLTTEIRQALGNDDQQGLIGMRSLADELMKRLENGQLPYLENGKTKSIEQLPYVNVVVEEAPSVLNPQRMKFGSVFRDISRQGRKFGIGLTVVSQQVSEIDQGVLTQINTELTMSLGNEIERKEAVRNASADLAGFERELQVMGKGQVIVTASYKDVPIPVQVPEYDIMHDKTI